MRIWTLLCCVIFFQNLNAQQPSFAKLTASVLPVGVQVVSEYREGIALTKQEGKFGMVNKQGQEVCPPKFEQARLFHEGYAAVQLRGKWSFVNKQGKRLTSFHYDWVSNFEKGFARVRLGEQWTLLNEQGLEITDQTFDAIGTFEKGRFHAMRNGNSFWIYEDGTIEPAKEAFQAQRDLPQIITL